MSSNRSNERDDWSRDERPRSSGGRDDYSRANNDSLGQSSRSGRGGSWSNLDDDDRMSNRSASRVQNPRSNDHSDMNDRIADGASTTSAYGDEHSSTGDRSRNTPSNRGGRDSEGRAISNRSNRSNSDMGADSWGGASDRDTGRDRYNSDRESFRDDYYGNRSINDDNYSSGRYGQMKGDRDEQHRSSDNGRDNQYDGSNRQQSEGTGRFNSHSGSNSDGQRSRGTSGRHEPDQWGMPNSSSAQRGGVGDGMRNTGGGMDGSGARDTNYGDRYTGRQGGSNQFSSWQNEPSDMQSRSTGSLQSRSQSGSSSATQSGMSRGQHAGRGPKGYRRDDTRITEDVNEAFTRDAHLDASEIEVKVANGEVTLTGTVDSRDAKRHAEDIAESVSGVNEVNNQIKVSRGSKTGHTSHTDDHAHSMTGGSSSTGDKNGDKHSEKPKSASGGPAAEHAMSTSPGTGPSDASNTSISSNNQSGKPSPNTSGASTQKTGDKGSHS